MTGRFGSPAEAFAAAARLGHTGRWSLFENVRQYLALSDGPSIGPVANPGVPASGVLWSARARVLVTLGVPCGDRAEVSWLRSSSRRPRGWRSRPSTSCSPTPRRPGSCCRRSRCSRSPRASDWRRCSPGSGSRERAGGARGARSSRPPWSWSGGSPVRGRDEGRGGSDGATSVRPASRPPDPGARGAAALLGVQRGELPDRRVCRRLPRRPLGKVLGPWGSGSPSRSRRGPAVPRAPSAGGPSAREHHVARGGPVAEGLRWFIYGGPASLSHITCMTTIHASSAQMIAGTTSQGETNHAGTPTRNQLTMRIGHAEPPR